jgi:hypothetical protein
MHISVYKTITMRIELDTINKVIRVDLPVNIGDLFELIERIIPKDEIKNYTIGVMHTNGSMDKYPQVPTLPWGVPSIPFYPPSVPELPASPVPPGDFHPTYPWYTGDKVIPGLHSGTGLIDATSQCSTLQLKHAVDGKRSYE